MALSKSKTETPLTRPFVITFSGIDGAGKTTQIEYLSSYLENHGLRVLLLSFWDHIAVSSSVVGRWFRYSCERDEGGGHPWPPGEVRTKLMISTSYHLIHRIGGCWIERAHHSREIHAVRKGSHSPE